MKKVYAITEDIIAMGRNGITIYTNENSIKDEMGILGEQHKDEFVRILMKTKFENNACEIYKSLVRIKFGDVIVDNAHIKETFARMLEMSELLYTLKTSEDVFISSAKLNQRCKLSKELKEYVINKIEDEYRKTLSLKEQNINITKDYLENKIHMWKAIVKMGIRKGRPQNNMRRHAAILVFVEYGLANNSKDFKIIFDCLDHFGLIPEEVKQAWNKQGWSKDEDKKNQYQDKDYIKALYTEAIKHKLEFAAMDIVG